MPIAPRQTSFRFQVLIGRLKTPLQIRPGVATIGFQVLIGRLKTEKYDIILGCPDFGFKSL